MPADPLDKQLVEAVLSRPRRAKADLEEAKLAGLRPSRAVAVAEDDDEDEDDDDDLDLGPDLAAEAVEGEGGPDGDIAVEVISEDGTIEPGSRLPTEGPTKPPQDSRVIGAPRCWQVL